MQALKTGAVVFSCLGARSADGAWLNRRAVIWCRRQQHRGRRCSHKPLGRVGGASAAITIAASSHLSAGKGMSRSADLRLGRYSERGRIYLLTATVQGRKPVFAEFAMGRLLVAELRSAHEDQLVESLAWVIMPDHFHWLVALENVAVGQLMRRVKGRSARRINQRAKLSRSLWQDGYHDRALTREQDLLAIARYVVANPLRAGLVSRLGDYPLWDAVWLESDRG